MAHLLTTFGGLAAGAAFTPLDVSGLKVWLDASDITTITKDGSDLVGQWRDKSGTSNHANQSTSSLKPLYQAAGLNSKPTICFDKSASTGVLVITDHASLDCSAFSIFVVGQRKDDTASIARMIWKWSGSPNQEFTFEWNNAGSDSARLQVSNSGTASTGSLSTSNAPALNTPVIVDAQYDGSSGTLKWNDGNSATSTIGSKGNYASDLQIGHAFADEQTISELLFYTSQVSGAQRTQIMQYLAAKWGITL